MKVTISYRDLPIVLSCTRDVNIKWYCRLTFGGLNCFKTLNLMRTGAGLSTNASIRVCALKMLPRIRLQLARIYILIRSEMIYSQFYLITNESRYKSNCDLEMAIPQFLPRHRKYSQSYCSKAIVYLSVYHRTFPTCLSRIDYVGLAGHYFQWHGIK